MYILRNADPGIAQSLLGRASDFFKNELLVNKVCMCGFLKNSFAIFGFQMNVYENVPSHKPYNQHLIRKHRQSHERSPVVKHSSRLINQNQTSRHSDFSTPDFTRHFHASAATSRSDDVASDVTKNKHQSRSRRSYGDRSSGSVAHGWSTSKTSRKSANQTWGSAGRRSDVIKKAGCVTSQKEFNMAVQSQW